MTTFSCPHRRFGPRLLVLIGLAVSVAAASGRVSAAGGGGDGATAPSARPPDPDYTAGVAAIKAGEYAKAVKLLESVTRKDRQNADAYNWLAYAVRKGGDPAKSIPIYEKALAIDPKHRGAHEYIGEAYLALDNMPKAKEHLKRLDSLCLLPCSEYTDLKRAVDAYERSGGAVKPTAGR